MIRVLVADDHAMIRELIALFLEQEKDIRVAATAGDGLEALELMRRTEPDVALFDWLMPSLNGLDAARQLLRMRPGFPIVLFTVQTDEHLAREALAAGVRGFVLKTEYPSCLVEAIRQVIAGGSFLSPSLASLPLDSAHPGRSGGLSPRESQVLQLLVEGKRNKDIAGLLELSVRTVEQHRTALMRKLEIYDLPGLTLYAVNKGLIHG